MTPLPTADAPKRRPPQARSPSASAPPRAAPGSPCISSTPGANAARPPGARPSPHRSPKRAGGLFLVAALADRWEVRDRAPVGKTVTVEMELEGEKFRK
ncbi:ATP-binding protein [Streptomyces sp. NPDC001665]